MCDNMSLPKTYEKYTIEDIYKIADYIDTKGGSCKTYISPFAVFLNENVKNYVEPDVSVICNPCKLNDRGCCKYR